MFFTPDWTYSTMLHKLPELTHKPFALLSAVRKSTRVKKNMHFFNKHINSGLNLYVVLICFAPVLCDCISISDLPTCAVAPVVNSFPESCNGDIACACQGQSFITSVIPLVEAACTPEELETAVSILGQLCL